MQFDVNKSYLRPRCFDSPRSGYGRVQNSWGCGEEPSGFH